MIYLDDVRTPVDVDNWVVVRSYDEFVSKVMEVGLKNIELVSLDHDLGDTAMNEYYNNVSPNYSLDYNNIQEKTYANSRLKQLLARDLFRKFGDCFFSFIRRFFVLTFRYIC